MGQITKKMSVFNKNINNNNALKSEMKWTSLFQNKNKQEEA